MAGSVLFVHGTGVRLEGCSASVAVAKVQAAAAQIDAAIVPCLWGEPLGTVFEGLSLPDSPDSARLEQEGHDLAQWTWLLDDPLAEMERLAIRGVQEGEPAPPGLEPWRKKLIAIRAYRPSQDVQALLDRTGMSDFWDAAFRQIVNAPVVDLAFERSDEAQELPDAIAALARAVAAELHNGAMTANVPALSANLRARLCQILTVDWDGGVAGLGTFFADMFKRAGTSMLRRRRGGFNNAIAAPVGDILLYQTQGQKIRDFIRGKIESAEGPVTVLAHSLGGIACVDLLAMPDAPEVHALVTIGSQAAYFHELGALASLQERGTLPPAFPRWLNIYDRSDFLSFVGERVFPGRVRDFEVHSGQPFPDSHSAYIGNPAAWTEIASICR